MSHKNKWIIGLFLIVVSLAISFLVYIKFSEIFWPSGARTYDSSQLSNLDIASVLIEANDLPTGYVPAKIEDIEPTEQLRFVQGKKQEILAPDGSIAGLVKVYLFSRKGEQEEMYNLLSLMETPEGMIPIEINGIGEMQLAAIDPFGFIVFTRCVGIGYISIEMDNLQKGYNFDYVVAHATRLDEQLKSIACEQP